MDLIELQRDLECVYELAGTAQPVADYLFSDAQLAGGLDPAGPGNYAEEALLIQQHGDELFMSLYLSEALMARLVDDSPLDALHDGNLSDLCLAVEGVSHYLFVSWNAAYDRPVTQVDLELQAEVDKFVAVVRLLERQGLPYSDAVINGLFRAVSFDDGLSPQEQNRYRLANRAAEAYCTNLSERYLSAEGVSTRTFYADLRRFYRLRGEAKLRYTALPERLVP